MAMSLPPINGGWRPRHLATREPVPICTYLLEAARLGAHLAWPIFQGWHVAFETCGLRKRHKEHISQYRATVYSHGRNHDANRARGMGSVIIINVHVLAFPFPRTCSFSAFATILSISPRISFKLSLNVCASSNFRLFAASRTNVSNNASCSSSGCNA